MGFKLKKTKYGKYISSKNQRFWIKFSFDSHKIKDLFGSVGIQQKQPFRGVLRKRCSEDMQQIYSRTPMSKCEFNKLHFGMGVLLYIKFAACIFSEYIFLRTPLESCFWYRLFSKHSSCIWKGVNSWKINERQKNFHEVLESGVGVEIKRHYILPWTNRVTSGP